MIDVTELSLKTVQDNNNVVILPVRGLLESGYFTSEGVLFINPDSFENIEPILTIAFNEDQTKVSNFLVQFTEITEKIFQENTIAIFSFDSAEYSTDTNNHYEDLDLLVKLSEKVFNALNIIRFIHCKLHVPETLPFIPGQWKNSNGFMGAVLITFETARIIAGRRGGSMMVGGLGLGLDALPATNITDHEYIYFLNPENPKIGEVGLKVRKALRILNKAVYANDETLKFITILALFEYLATGSTYTSFQKVRPKIQAHVATSEHEYNKLTERFMQLTSKKDPNGIQIGYRTQIIHGGALIEEILPSSRERESLFIELFGYSEKVIKDMINNSYISFNELQEKRKSMMEKIGIKT